MRKREVNNQGLYIENMNVSGGESYVASGDIYINNDNSGMNLQDFQNLLTQTSEELKKINLHHGDKDVIQANLNLAKKQSQKVSPIKNLILDPLKIAFNLLVQAAGAATATETIIKSLQKAIAFAEQVF